MIKKQMILLVMLIQVGLIGLGIWLLFKGEIALGIFNIVINLAFMFINWKSLKKCNDE